VTLTLKVAAIEEAAPGVRALTLQPTDDARLPSYPPGSHLVLECGGRRNAYSLTGSGMMPSSYSVSVRLSPDGAGGSAWVHSLAVGDEVVSTTPRSAFAPVASARHHLLVAAGIGVTPMLSHVRAALVWNRPFTFLFGHRAGVAPHLDELRELCGDRLHEFEGRAALVDGLEEVLGSASMGTHLYACGPAGLLDHLAERAAEHGWPVERVHTERFCAADLAPGELFEALLARSGRRIPVPAGVSLLEALEGAGIAVPSRCRQGVCGECRVEVRAGTPEHRDLYLTDDEKQTAESIMTCVSRCYDDCLELDL
jgi:dimethylamine monooxygenase subunit B